MSDAGPKSKGLNFSSVQAFVRERHGEDAWPRVLARLAPEDRDTVVGHVAVGWYPTDLLLRLTDATEAEVLQPGVSFRQAMGRHGAEHHLSVVLRVLLRMASPGYVLEKAGQIWSRFHDTGTWTIARGPTSATGTLSGFVAHAGFCQGLTAYIARMFELVGARDVVVEHPRCRARGDAVCRWDARWR